MIPVHCVFNCVITVRVKLSSGILVNFDYLVFFFLLCYRVLGVHPDTADCVTLSTLSSTPAMLTSTINQSHCLRNEPSNPQHCYGFAPQSYIRPLGGNGNPNNQRSHVGQVISGVGEEKNP